MPGEEPTLLRPLDNPGANLREALAELIREDVEQSELASDGHVDAAPRVGDGHVDAAPRVDFTELVR